MSVFSAVARQGAPLSNPVSASDAYYGFLSKIDLDFTSQTYDVLFEMVPREWMDNAVLSTPTPIRMPLPVSPASLYFLPGIEKSALLQVLGLDDIDDVAEGSWYLLQVRQGQQGVSGIVYDPDIDTQGPT